jgi:hypothetical protein
MFKNLLIFKAEKVIHIYDNFQLLPHLVHQLPFLNPPRLSLRDKMVLTHSLGIQERICCPLKEELMLELLKISFFGVMSGLQSPSLAG